MIILVGSFGSSFEHDEDGPTINETLQNLSETLKDEGYGFNSSFDGEITIPEPLEIPARILLGIPRGETAPIEIFIVLISLWISMFMLIFGILHLAPFMEAGYVRFLGAVVIMSLISMTGVILMLVNYLFDLLNFFDWIEKLGVWQIVLGIVVCVLVIFVVKKIMNFFGLKVKQEQDDVVVEKMKLLGTTAKEVSKG
jgi:hypothetical protein